MTGTSIRETQDEARLVLRSLFSAGIEDDTRQETVATNVGFSPNEDLAAGIRRQDLVGSNDDNTTHIIARKGRRHKSDLPVVRFELIPLPGVFSRAITDVKTRCFAQSVEVQNSGVSAYNNILYQNPVGVLDVNANSVGI